MNKSTTLFQYLLASYLTNESASARLAMPFITVNKHKKAITPGGRPYIMTQVFFTGLILAIISDQQSFTVCYFVLFTFFMQVYKYLYTEFYMLGIFSHRVFKSTCLLYCKNYPPVKISHITVTPNCVVVY